MGSIVLDLVEDIFQQGVQLHKSGKVEIACQLYSAVLKVHPEHPTANHSMGVLAVEVGKVQEALVFFEAALEANPATAQFWLSYIDALIKLEKLADAKAVLDQAKNKGAKGDGFDTLETRLNERYEEPLEASKIASEPTPKKPNILDSLKLDQAISLAKKKAKEGSLEESKRIYQDILAKFPKNKRASDGLKGLAGGPVGKVSTVQDAPTAELQSLIALYNNGQLALVVEQAQILTKQYPKAFAVWNLMGASAAQIGQLDQAIFAFKRVLAIQPDSADAHNNIGNALKDQGKLEEAIEAYNKALAIMPDYAIAYNNMGVTLKEQGKLEEAIEAYNKALAIKPDYAEAYYNMGNALKEQGKLEGAIEAYNKALGINPDYEGARVQKLHQKAHICDWSNIAKDIERLPRLGTTREYVFPFDLLFLEDAPERHRTRAETYAAATYQQRPLPGQVKPSQKPKRIRLGYFSSDLKEHPVAYLMAKMLEQHDRDQFEVFGYSLHGNQQSDMRQRLSQSFDSFADVQGMSDRDVALQAWQDGIDIAIDLNGYTQYNRTGIFAYRAAPIQINYLGYPGTLGADFMDYIVADKFLIPEANQKYFNEQPLYLPHTYMPTDDTRELSQKPISRKDVGLPNDAFVFCCFNNNYKISSAEFDIWMRLLNKVEGSVLWLRKSNEISHLNMKKEAQKRDIDPSRLVFADRAPMDEHLARQRLADLFVDTFAFNAHTTATEALWAGLPVVTKAGQGFAARVAGSLLNAIGLPELVTTTEQDYEELILELATNPTKLAQVKDKLATNRLTQPLFNTELYTKHLENGYHQAYQNYFDGNPPQTITVPR